jgi:hypothetical protein
MNKEMELMQIISWCHQCYQVLMIDQSIDVEEFARRLNADTVDYRQVLVDYNDMLSNWDYDTSSLYIQRVIDILYPAPTETPTEPEAPAAPAGE